MTGMLEWLSWLKMTRELVQLKSIAGTFLSFFVIVSLSMSMGFYYAFLLYSFHLWINTSVPFLLIDGSFGHGCTLLDSSCDLIGPKLPPIHLFICVLCVVRLLYCVSYVLSSSDELPVWVGEGFFLSFLYL